MSTIIMAACWPLQGLSITQKAILISLADQANDDGVCWPSVGTISARTCASERSVRSALRELEEKGLLTSHQRSGRSTYYTLTPANAAPLREMPPANVAPHPGESCPPPRQMPQDTPANAAPRTVIEPKGEPSRNRKSAKDTFTVDQMLASKPSDLSEQTCRDYHQFRKRKGPINATIWQTVLQELVECKRHGISADKALAEAMTAGWQGFKTDWLLNRLQIAQPAARPGATSLLTNLPVHTAEMYESNPDGKF